MRQVCSAAAPALPGSPSSTVFYKTVLQQVLQMGRLAYQVPALLGNITKRSPVSIPGFTKSLQGRLFCAPNICACGHETSTCVKCKGKGKANGLTRWILDSGASRHFTFNKDELKNYRAYDTPRQTQTANGFGQLLGEGDVDILQVDDKNEPFVILHLQNVVYMPDLSVRLISPGQLMAEEGYTTGGRRKLSLDVRYVGQHHRRIFP